MIAMKSVMEAVMPIGLFSFLVISLNSQLYQNLRLRFCVCLIVESLGEVACPKAIRLLKKDSRKLF
jgi:hypothetical protein